MTQSDPDHDIDAKWLADAKAGDFSTMPVPFKWKRSAAFAHIIDGYAVAGGGVERCQEIAGRVIERGPEKDDRTASALELWVALFTEHRRWRHSGYSPDKRDRVYLNSLCEALRKRLQTLTPDAHCRLLGVMAEHPWT
jgi:hypothetical protein